MLEEEAFNFGKKTFARYGDWLACIGVAGMLVSLCTGVLHKSQEVPIVPWRAVGGCGAGGSGSGGATTVKWVGNGVSGGLIDVQTMAGDVLLRDNTTGALVTRISFKPTYTTQLGLTIPVLSKDGVVQPTTAYPRTKETTNGTGDLMIDGTMNFGIMGEYSAMLSVTLPTGQYDIVRGQDAVSYLLPSNLQMGGGLYVPALTLSYSRDVNKGIWLFDFAYSHPVAMRLFTGKNEFVGNGSYYSAYKDSTANKRFYYRFKPYGENDLGDYTPPSVSGSVYFGYKGVPEFCQSVGVTFGVPLGIAWIHQPVMTGTSLSYDPRPDPDHKSWNMQLIYSVEKADPKFPLFFALVKPIHDKPDARGVWDAPDAKAIINEWSFFVGLKTTLF